MDWRKRPAIAIAGLGLLIGAKHETMARRAGVAWLPD